MKRASTILRDIENKRESVLETYNFSRINSYFNFFREHTANTFIFREFVSMIENKKVLDLILNEEIYLILYDYKIKAVSREVFEEHYMTASDYRLEDYRRYLEQYRD